MKTLTMILLTILCLTLFSGESYAKKRWDKDFGFMYGTPPLSNTIPFFGIAGFTGGIGPDLADWSSVILNLRIDLSWYYWKKPYGVYVDNSITRIPICIGPRIYFPLGKYVLPFVEGGGEVSFDLANNKTNKGIHFGGYAGGGINFRFRRGFVLGVNARYHIIRNSYLTVGPVIGTRW